MSRIHHRSVSEYDNIELDRHSRSSRSKGRQFKHEDRSPRAKRREPDGSESFKCGHCKAFIGPTISGGRHRNHCPLCLYSRHVDDRRPGDRASTCRSLMEAVGTFNRPKGEQVIVHRCLGCGVERYNRVAADDNMLACMRLAPVEPRSARLQPIEETFDEEAIA